MRRTNNPDVNIILDRFNNGIYTYGKHSMLEKEDMNELSRPVIEWFKRTPKLCATMVNNGKFRFCEVPEFSRVPEFFITTYPHHQIYDYIKKHANLFDREFYKDLISSNKKALFESSNIFDIMPEEYIDEEMVELAIVSSIENNSYNWMLAVIDRKLSALSEEALRVAVSSVKLDDNDNRYPIIRELREEMKFYNVERIQYLEDECTVYLPAKFEGEIPVDYTGTYDKDEYLVYMYAKYGIEVIEKVNDFFYKVQIPEDFIYVLKDPIGYLMDSNGEEIVKFRFQINRFNQFAYAMKIKNDEQSLLRK